MTDDKLSQEQIGELKQAFQMFDRDQGGSISSKELGRVMRAMGMNPTEAEIMDLLNEVHRDAVQSKTGFHLIKEFILNDKRWRAFKSR